MYRILVVDDEPAIVRGIVQTLKEDASFEIDILQAFSGPEALNLLYRERIHIVITDIRMPGMSGLQLCERTLEYWSDCRFIFLTGYSEFEFVYKAIQYPRTQYVLKVESDTVLLEAVREAICQIQLENEQHRLIEYSNKQLQEMLPLVRRELFESILMDDEPDQDLKEQFDEIGVCLDAAMPVMLMKACINLYNVQYGSNECIRKLRMADSAFSQIQSAVIRAVSIIYKRKYLVWFLQPLHFDSENCTNFLNIVKGCAEKTQDLCRDKLHLDVSFILSDGLITWKQLREEIIVMEHLSGIACLEASERIIVLKKQKDLFNGRHQASAAENFRKCLNNLEDNMVNSRTNDALTAAQGIISMLKQGLASDLLLNLKYYYLFYTTLVSHLSLLDANEGMEDNIKRLYQLIPVND